MAAHWAKDLPDAHGGFWTCERQPEVFHPVKHGTVGLSEKGQASWLHMLGLGVASK